jgi:hypothetical protein
VSLAEQITIGYSCCYVLINLTKKQKCLEALWKSWSKVVSDGEEERSILSNQRQPEVCFWFIINMHSSCLCSMVDELTHNAARFYKCFSEVGMQAYFYGCTCVCLFFVLLMSSCSGWAAGESERWVVDQSSIWGVWSPVTNEWPNNLPVQHIHSIQLAVNSE